jgi:glycosyltransferase involved in cell wall biosynthesis
MACGIPAVVSEAVGCMPDLIDEGITGRSYQVGNVQALALAINRVLNDLPVGDALVYKVNNYSVEKAVSGVMWALKELVAN